MANTKYRSISRNVLTDEGALDELLALGTRQLPVISRGKDWVNGQSLKEIARLVGIDLGTAQAPAARGAGAAHRRGAGWRGALLRAVPRGLAWATSCPGRPRSYAQLAWHLFNVVDAFLEHEQGIPLSRLPPTTACREDGTTRPEILAYGADVKRRFGAWWEGAKARTDWPDKASVYYGDVSRHEFLERTTWHAGQHARQLMWVLEDKFADRPGRPDRPRHLEGLPMPEKVWDS